MSVAPLARAAPDLAACVAASEAGQQLRDEGKLVDARDRFVECANTACPGVVQKDCSQWLSDVQGSLPTVVFSAKDAKGQDVLDVRVSEGPRVVATSLGGKGVFVNPGPHTFRFESAHGTVEQKIIVREGEKNRQVSVVFGEPSREPPTSTSTPAATEAGSSGSGRKTAAFVVGGLGVVALGVGTVFGIRAIGKRADSDKECPADNCSAAGVSLNKEAITAAWISDIGIGAGVVGIGVAAYLLVTGRSEPRASAVHFVPSASHDAAGLSAVGTF